MTSEALIREKDTLIKEETCLFRVLLERKDTESYGFWNVTDSS